MRVTTIEQSLRLIELGLKKTSSDLYYHKGHRDELEVIVKHEYLDDEDIIAWSLDALLEVMRKLNAVVTLQVTELATFLRIKDMGFIWQKDIHVKDPMDAVYGGMLWLFEQGLIKKGDNDDSKD